MRALKLTLLGAVVVLLVVTAWQVGSRELANFELQDDLHDMASQLGARIGFNAPHSDDEYRNMVIRKAGDHGIVLTPEQVTVRRTGEGSETTAIYLAADYTAAVKLPGWSFALHFTPSSEKNSRS